VLQKCANPACGKPFRKLKAGRLFAVETGTILKGGRAAKAGWSGRRIEHFWLCGECAATLTLTFVRGRGVVAVPLPKTERSSQDLSGGTNV